MQTDEAKPDTVIAASQGCVSGNGGGEGGGSLRM